MSTLYDDLITGTSGNTHYYKFEGNGNDSKGSTNMTIASGYSTSSAGREGNGLTADGSSKTGCTVAIANTVFNTTYSVEMWFKYTAGAAQELMRMADDLALEMNTDGTILYYYNGSIGTTTGAYGDGAWHHLVITRDGSRNVIVYVDGSSQITFTAPNSAPTSASLYLAGSQYSSQAAISGQMDSIAFYNVALSSGTVTAHKNAMGTGGFTAAAMTATADTVTPVVKTNHQVISVTDDFDRDNTGSTLGQSTTIHFGLNSGAMTGYFKTGAVSLTSGDGLTTAKLRLYITGITNGTGVPTSFDIYEITSAWTDSSTVEPSKTYYKTVTISPTLNTTVDFDVTEIVADWLAGGTNYGIAINNVVNGSLTVASSENATVANRPVLIVDSLPSTPGGFTASAMTASALVVAPTISVADGYVAQPMTADATFVAPTWAHDGNVVVNAESMDAYAEMPGGQHEGPVTVSAGVMTASAADVSPTVTVQVGAINAAAPMTATARWVKPSGINGTPISIPETEDKYFNRVYAATPKIWYRFLETSGTHADDRMNYFADEGATYSGVTLGEFAGPEGRASVHFDSGDYIRQVETGPFPEGEFTPTDANGVTRTTLEFGIRTTKRNQFIMGGRDDAQVQTRTATIESTQAARELYLRDGKIAMVAWYFPDSLGRARDAYQFVGFKNLADGLWHHVVVKGYNSWGGEEGVEIWVDGKLEIRRTGNPSGAAPWNGMPDWVGLRPDTLDGEYLSALPSSLYFEGDLSELAFYGTLLTDDAVPRHYYDFMGWNPIETAPMEAFAFTPAGAKGKGNQKRMLVLTWSPINGDESYNPFLNDTSLYTFNGVAGNTGQFLGYKVFAVNIAIKGPGTEVFRDQVTDAATLISLRTDLDIRDYDAIAFTDWPWQGVRDMPNILKAPYERLISDIRWACDQGLGLFITHPRVALDLGIIDRIEFAPSQKEIVSILAQGNAQGLYDYGSAVEFPWNIAGSSQMDDTWGGKGSIYNGQEENTDPTFLANKAYFYGDTHKNDKFRVRALIDGLTDIPSYMTEKAIFQVDQSNYGWQIAAYKYLHRENGLQIGDEYIFWGTDYGFNNNWLSSMGLNSTGRWGGAYATPLANVKAGTVVTTFGSSYWQGKSIIDNPYKDYATTIVLQPGDSLNGTSVGGKIYVNFTEQPWLQADQVARQVIPNDDNPAHWPVSYHVETNEQRQWDYSETRKTLSVTGSQSSNVTYQIALPDGSLATITGSSGGNATLNMVRSSELFPIQHQPSWQMNRRGLLWLYNSGVIDGEGDTTVRATPMAATADIKQPSTVAQKSNAILAEPMRALVQMPKVREDQSGDVEIITFPMEAHATFTGYSKSVSAGPMTATAEFNEPAEVHGGGEQFVLYLQTTPLVTLFIKEEV